MKLVDILEPGRIVHRLTATTKIDVLRELVQRGLVPPEANTELGVADEEQIVRVLEERERLGSTGIKDGLAIPHGKLERLDQIVACLGLAPHGIDFGALDGQPSKVFIVLLAPESAGGLHLKALARISRVFSDASLHQRLLDAADVEGVWRAITAEDQRY
ncbi:MAG: PTS sugar transporter subunit IIA [Deltaproteobacteria bacterium]|nr:PTS sugar transporter subunit IIA [Deltaproteobacteria bacterium]